jgi:hypothetical protein
MDEHFATLMNGGGPLCAIQRLKAKCDEALSNFAFELNMCRYTKALLDAVFPPAAGRGTAWVEDDEEEGMRPTTPPPPVTSGPAPSRKAKLTSGRRAGAYTRSRFSSTLAPLSTV